jgi:hypothetical protein
MFAGMDAHVIAEDGVDPKSLARRILTALEAGQYRVGE